MGFSGAGFGIELGDKLHKNFMQTGQILADRAQAGQNLDENRRQFNLDYDLRKMLTQQEAESNQMDLDWRKKMRNAFMK